jgi:hypothetical protein
MVNHQEVKVKLEEVKDKLEEVRVKLEEVKVSLEAMVQLIRKPWIVLKEELISLDVNKMKKQVSYKLSRVPYS